MPVSLDTAGGGIVRRGFDRVGVRVTPGTLLTVEELQGFSLPNLNSLVDSKYIEVFPADLVARRENGALRDRIRELEVAARPGKPR